MERREGERRRGREERGEEEVGRRGGEEKRWRSERRGEREKGEERRRGSETERGGREEERRVCPNPPAVHPTNLIRPSMLPHLLLLQVRPLCGHHLGQ